MPEKTYLRTTDTCWFSFWFIVNKPCSRSCPHTGKKKNLFRPKKVYQKYIFNFSFACEKGEKNKKLECIKNRQESKSFSLVLFLFDLEIASLSLNLDWQSYSWKDAMHQTVTGPNIKLEKIMLTVSLRQFADSYMWSSSTISDSNWCACKWPLVAMFHKPTWNNPVLLRGVTFTHCFSWNLAPVCQWSVTLGD